MEKLQIFFNVISILISLITIGFFKKLRNLFFTDQTTISNTRKNVILTLIIIFFIAIIVLGNILYTTNISKEGYKYNLSEARTDKEILQTELDKCNQAENPLGIVKSYVEFGNDLKEFKQDEIYDLTWKIMLNKKTDLKVIAYALPYQDDKDVKPNLYVNDDFRNIEVTANNIAKIPLVLDTGNTSFGLYLACIKIIDASLTKEGKYYETYEDCKDTFRIVD